MLRSFLSADYLKQKIRAYIKVYNSTYVKLYLFSKSSNSSSLNNSSARIDSTFSSILVNKTPVLFGLIFLRLVNDLTSLKVNY